MTSVELCPGAEHTVVELREALRVRGLTTSGTKAELIKRLSEYDPNVWEELGSRGNNSSRVADVVRLEVATQPTVDDEVVGIEMGDEISATRVRQASIAGI